MTIKELYEKAKKHGRENLKVMICDGYGIKEIDKADFESYQYVNVLYNFDGENK